MRLEPLVPSLNTPDKPLGALTRKGYLRVCLNAEKALAEKDAQIARLTAERDQARAKAIEECARVAETTWITYAESLDDDQMVLAREDIAKAIRAQAAPPAEGR